MFFALFTLNKLFHYTKSYISSPNNKPGCPNKMLQEFIFSKHNFLNYFFNIGGEGEDKNMKMIPTLQRQFLLRPSPFLSFFIYLARNETNRINNIPFKRWTLLPFNRNFHSTVAIKMERLGLFWYVFWIEQRSDRNLDWFRLPRSVSAFPYISKIRHMG